MVVWVYPAVGVQISYQLITIYTMARVALVH